MVAYFAVARHASGYAALAYDYRSYPYLGLIL